MATVTYLPLTNKVVDNINLTDNKIIKSYITRTDANVHPQV